ncbi:unnamed protein product, partial [Symbiodinium necroappetens]
DAKVSRGPEKQTGYRFAVFSFNVLTMFDPQVPKGRPKRLANLGLLVAGKRDVLKKQLGAKGIWLAGFQETRIPITGTLPDKDYIMLNSGATERGHGGCALWIAREVAFGRSGSQSLHITEEQVTVVATSPRHLQVLLEHPRLALTVLVAHAPRVSGQGEEAVISFWNDRYGELQRRPRKADYLILADANAHIGSVTTDVIGSFGAEPENEEGFLFHEFLLRMHAYIPSTWNEHHQGQHWTWAPPEPDGTKHRIDFIGVPGSWSTFSLSSHVWDSFEAMHARQDHLPVVLEVEFQHLAPSYSYRSGKGPVLRPSRDLSLEDRDSFAVLVQQARGIPWESSVDQHNAQWTRHIQACAQPLIPEQPYAPTQSYLSSDTMRLVGQRREIRAYIRDEEQELRKRWLLIGFAAFRLHHHEQVFSETALSTASHWVSDIDHSIAAAVERLAELTRAVRAAVKRDRIEYLDSLQKEVTVQDLRNPKALYRAVRKAFPEARSSRRRGFRPLPAVRLEDGTLAPDRESRAARWERYFGEQESAFAVSDTEYQQAFAKPDLPVGRADPVFSLQALPTLQELEQQLLQLKLGKAAGPDGLTAEVLRIHVAGVARTLFPVCLKAALGNREPTAWRGGSLMALAKKASAALDGASFRSILLANATAKVQHRLLRGRLMPYFAAYKLDTQAGQAPGVGVDSIGLVVRAYQIWAKQKKMASSLTFFDLKTAFYRVLRQVLVPSEKGAGDAAFVRLLSELGVPDQAVCELATQLGNMVALAEAGVSDHLMAQTADLFRGSWFKLQGETTIWLTRRGTRPGDPLADLLFAFSFTACCRAIDDSLQSAGLQTSMPEVAMSPPWHSWEAPDTLGLPAWADDFVFLQADPSPVRLCQRTKAAVEVIAAKTTSVGMQLTYASDKTALLLSTEVTRPLDELVLLNEQGEPGMPVRDKVVALDNWLPVVDSYKHLGSIAVANTAPVTEVHYRFAQAQAVLRPLRRKLFGAGVIPLKLRTTLLRALVVSKFVFSSATLHLNANVHRRTWSRLYVSLWRSLTRRTSATDQSHSYEVLRVAGATSPLLALAQARATFFRRVLIHGPAALLHCLHVQWRTQPATSWLHQFMLDIRAVAVYSNGAKVLLDEADPVGMLCETMQQDPGWWSSQVRKAIKGYADDLQKWSQKRYDPSDPEVETEQDKPFHCPHCGAAFLLRKHLGVHLARPLSVEEIVSAEATDKQLARKVKAGRWNEYRAALPPLPAYGPRMPTYTEAVTGLSEDELLLSRVKQLYRPHPDTVRWIHEYLDAASTEGPREAATDFWIARPTAHRGPSAAAAPVSPL